MSVLPSAEIVILVMTVGLPPTLSWASKVRPPTSQVPRWEDLLAQRDITVTYQPSGSGVSGSARCTLDVFGAAVVGWVTPGICTSCS